MWGVVGNVGCDMSDGYWGEKGKTLTITIAVLARIDSDNSLGILKGLGLSSPEERQRQSFQEIINTFK